MYLYILLWELLYIPIIIKIAINSNSFKATLSQNIVEPLYI